MFVNKKIFKNLKTGVLRVFFLLIFFIFSGCDNTMVNDLELNEDMVEEHSGDVFVNGFNKTFMDKYGLTEDDLMDMIIASNKLDSESTTRSLRSILGSDLFDILVNLEDYFSLYIDEDNGIKIRIGCDTNLLATPLANLNKRIKDTRYNKVDIYSFSIERIENQFVYLKGRIHVQSYTDLPWPFDGVLQIADKKGDIKVKVEFLSYLSSTSAINEIGYAYEVTEVTLDRSFIDIILSGMLLFPIPGGVEGIIINEIVRAKVRSGVMADGRGYYLAELDNYIDPEYFLINKVTSSGTWLYFNFQITSKGQDIINTLISLLKINPVIKVIHSKYYEKKVYPAEDALISNVVSNGNDSSGKNYGSYPYFQATCWTYQGVKGTQRSLMKFSTDSLPDNIASARLYLFGLDHNPLTRSNACYVQRVTSSWSENSVTWNSQPSITTSSQVSIGDLSSPNLNTSVNITQMAKRWKSSIPFLKWDNHGILLKLKAENYYTKMQFASREYSSSNKRPYLKVKYFTRTITE